MLAYPAPSLSPCTAPPAPQEVPPPRPNCRSLADLVEPQHLADIREFLRAERLDVATGGQRSQQKVLRVPIKVPLAPGEVYDCSNPQRIRRVPPNPASVAINAATFLEMAARYEIPDQEIVYQVATGGIDLGVAALPPEIVLCRNNTAGFEHIDALRALVDDEVSQQWVKGPFTSLPMVPIHVNPLGWVPKEGAVGRKVVDLSAPRDGTSPAPNDVVPLEDVPQALLPRLRNFFTAAKIMLSAGQRVEMCKVDLRAAYRTYMVAPQQRWTNCFAVDGRIYVDERMPFGARMAAAQMQRISAAILYMLRAKAKSWHAQLAVGSDPLQRWRSQRKQQGLRADLIYVDVYLDDFIIMVVSPTDRAAEDNPLCRRIRDTLVRMLRSLNIPVNAAKLAREGAFAQQHVVLGVAFDMNASDPGASLPEEKRQQLAELFDQWQGRSHGDYDGLSSLAGFVARMTVVTPQAKTYADPIWRAATAAKKASVVRLGTAFHQACRWLATLLKGSAHRYSLRPARPKLQPPTSFFAASDAAGSDGYGAVCSLRPGELQYISGSWPASANPDININVLELAALFLWLATFGPSLRQHELVFHIDNTAAMWASTTMRSSRPAMSYLLRHIHWLLVDLDIIIVSRYIATEDNTLADALSRSDWLRFQQAARSRGFTSLAQATTPQHAITVVERLLSNIDTPYC